jgi:TolC family type I secretion outer membrane protein
MYKLSKCVLTAAVIAALSCSIQAEAKGSVTRLTTDPEITEKAIASQLDRAGSADTVNFNNMLLQKNLGNSLPEVVSGEVKTIDIDLKGVISTSIQNNRDIMISDLNRKVAEAAVSSAAAKKNPQLAYSWSRSQIAADAAKRNGGQGSNHSYDQGLSVTLPIWTGGSVEGAINQARYQKNIADLEYYRTEANTKLTAVKAYYKYLENIKLAEVQAESVNDYASHLENVQQQFDAGIVAKLDVLTSNVSLANAKSASITANNDRDVAEANLNNIMRIPMNTKLNPLDKDFPEPDFDLTLDQAIAMAQKYRWELIEADYNVRIANEQLRIAKAGYMPSLSVKGGYNWDKAGIGEVNKDDWSVMGSVSWNLWDGGATDAAIKSANANIRIAQEQLLQSREMIELEVRQDYLDILAAKEQIRAMEASVAQAEEAYKIATVRYSSGVGINLDVLDAELQLNQAKTNYITALYNYNIGLATLEYAMGIPAVIHPEFAK